MSTQFNDPTTGQAASPPAIAAVARTKPTAEHAHEVGMPSPEAITFMMSIASMLITSALVTPDMAPPEKEIDALLAQGWKPEQIDAYREKVIKSNAMAKMLVGREMGMQAMESLQDIDIVKGKIFIRYPQLISQMIRKGFACKWVERTNERAALEVTRPGLEPELFEYTIADAERAGSLKGNKDYNQYILRPRVMLTARVASESYRTTGGRSNVYTPEEKSEVIESNSTTAEPSEADRKRMDVLNNGMGDYKVAVKPQPVTVEVKVEPTPAPAAEAVVAEPAKVTPLPEVVTAPAAAEPAKAAPPLPVYTTLVATTNATVMGDPAPAPAPAPVAQAAGPVLVPPPTTPFLTAQQKADLEAERANFRMRMEALATELGIAVKTAVTRFNAFHAGYLGLNIKELPKDATAYRDSMLNLEAVIALDPEEFRAGPEQSGKRRREQTEGLMVYLTKQFASRADTIELAKRLAIKWGHDAGNLSKWLEATGLDFMPVDDATAFFRIVLRTREAAKLLKPAEQHRLSLAFIVGQIELRALEGQKIEEAPPALLNQAITAFIQAIQDEAKKLATPAAVTAPQPSPPPPPPPAEEAVAGGLWED